VGTIAWLGAGLLGSGFVQSLLRQGHQVRVWNRTAYKVEALAAFGAVPCNSPSEAAAGAERVHLVLSDDAAVDATLAALADSPAGKAGGPPIFDHTTTSAAGAARRYEAAQAAGGLYLHAPVFMGPAHARDAAGLMCVAGPEAQVEPWRPALAALTGRLWWVGPEPDRAAALKLAGNATLIATVGVVADALALQRAAGHPAEDLLLLLQGFDLSAMVRARAKRALQDQVQPASFELSMARKDVRLMLEQGDPRAMSVLPALAERLDRLIADGHGHLDLGALATDR
jgi:3-hydroxyisobutyrate dehydrogenase-like beta-hydroxyacid dehydrogenase